MGELPDRFGLAPDRSLLRFVGGTVLAGGHPGRVTTLTPDGAAALDALIAGGTATDPAIRAMAGRLVDSGMAHPRRPTGVDPVRPVREVTVVVPVRDRPDALDRCLTSLGTDHPVVVVDDASYDPEALAAVCTTHGATIVRRNHNGGPGVARNDALEKVASELVAFVDSDCTVSPGWLDGLTWLFDDPEIGAVAPRVVPAPPDTHRAVDRFARAHSPLDLGPDEGEVGPRRAVRYVPTAALVVRREALKAIGGFDPDLRVGEDVDLVWRLLDAGWRVRYQPAVTVAHAEPRRWIDLTARRFRYGTSAAPLAERHPGRLAPVELRPWPTVAALAALVGRPRTAAAVVALSAAVLTHSVRPLGIPSRQAWTWSAQGAGWTLVGLGRASTMLAGPGLILLAFGGRRGRRAALALAVLPPIVEWVRRRPDLDIFRWVVASAADDAAYGAGVWTSCLKAGTFGPVLPASRLWPGES